MEQICQHPLASIVSMEEDGMTANHIPLIITPLSAVAPLGTLRGHVARANPVWENKDQLLLIFQGASAYIRPGWHEERMKTGAVVPTYDYAVVHGHGHLRIVDDHREFYGLPTQLTDHFESKRKLPWSVSDAPRNFIDRLMAEIVGIEIPLIKLVGKWKANQDDSTSSRSHIALQLREENSTQGGAMADIIESRLFEK
ncbi:FMN-binding negative transcriptional regulator [Undibacterium jejuense]|uniref:FMN-binding negative transcriptional regulator n=2 Tax=Undibacterium jejuense TaxID=1344949 RepID=A0A923HEM9_9BURK|nr:FMN-binding negative transcriptional regulator [Undibacterium jejuense]MBC3862636.1 FMN-binding negative transcriptional regulator [Undibacterium jejuense]